MMLSSSNQLENASLENGASLIKESCLATPKALGVGVGVTLPKKGVGVSRVRPPHHYGVNNPPWWLWCLCRSIAHDRAAGWRRHWLDATARLMGLVIGSRASALLSVAPCALPPSSSIPSASPPDSERVPKLDRRSGSEAGERGAKRTASDAPAHSPAAEVGAAPRLTPKFARSRAGSPTRATCCKAIFPTSSPPYPKGGA